MSLTSCIHGYSGVGKSWLLDSMPAPRLIIDAEGGSRFTKSPKVIWNPLTEAPPKFEETTIVYATDYDVLDRVYQWLVSGDHIWRSIGVDHLTEIQERVIYKFNGTNALRDADWGTLLRHMKDYVRKHRDLVFMPSNTIECVTFACATESRDGRIIPQLSGKMRDALPYLLDLIGYMYLEQTEDGPISRKLLIQPYPPFEAKDRTDILSATYGPVLTIADKDNPDSGTDMSKMLALATQQQATEGGSQ